MGQGHMAIQTPKDFGLSQINFTKYAYSRITILLRSYRKLGLF